MDPMPKQRSNWRATTFSTARILTKPSNGPRRFPRAVAALRGASRFVRSPDCLLARITRRSPRSPSKMPDVRSVAESVFRQESGRIVASLIRVSGSFDRAEEAMQEAFAAALASWIPKGIPENPGAWIMAAAHRKLIDAVRREYTRRNKQEALRYEIENTGSLSDPDSQS